MIARQPDLARLLDLLLHPESPITLDLVKFEKQVHYALSREDAEWAGRELKLLNEIADRYLVAGDPRMAGTLYYLVLEKALIYYEGWWPEWDSKGPLVTTSRCCGTTAACTRTGGDCEDSSLLFGPP